MAKKVREEGHYTLKRVERLPVYGNANLLYAIINDENIISEVYRWKANTKTYEKLQIGGNLSEVNNNFIGNQIVIGSYVHLGGLTYFFWADLYYINGVRYDDPISAQITLSDSDPANDRIDLPVITAPNTIEIIEGTAMANPSEPDINEETQVAYPFIIVEAGTTAPTGITNEVVYNENTGEPSEWTATSNSAAINVGSTDDSQNGSTSIRFNNAAFRRRVDFVNDTLVNGQSVSNLLFRVKLLQAPSNHRLFVRCYNTSGPDGIGITINNGQFGYDTSNIGGWQLIVIPATVLGINTKFIDQIRIANWRGGASDFFIDNVVLQSGTSFTLNDPAYTLDLDTSNLSLQRDGISVSTVDLSGLGGGGGGYLEGIDEGNGLGYRIKDQDPAKFANTGFGTVDLQINDGYTGTDFGGASSAGFLVGGGNKIFAGGSNFGQHVAIGSTNEVQGYYNNMALGTFHNITNGYSSVALGYGHDINLAPTVGQGFASGTANTLRGYWSSAIGAGLLSKWKSSLVIGEGNTDLGGLVDDPDRPLFVIGNGDVSALTVSYADINAQSDAFIVRYDGSIEAPSITNTLIDSVGAKSLVSREWVLANLSNIYSQNGTINEPRTVTVADEQSLIFTGTVNSVFNVTTGGINLNANGGTLTLATLANANSISLPNSSNMNITATNGLRLNLGTVPTIGQALVASTGNGDLGWATIGGAFEVLNEGNGDGIVKAGRNAANFGNIGLGSVDLSNSTGVSSTRGATGDSSVTMGDNTTASENRAFAGGFDTVASGRTSFAYGEGCEASGFGAIALNGANFSRSYFETVIGLLATDYTPNSTNANDEGDRIFTIGVGTFPANRSDGFTVLKNGNAAFGKNNFEANDTGEPLQVNGLVRSEATIANIDAGNARVLTTKEWVQANAGGGAFEVIDEGAGNGIIVSGRNAANFGNVGLGAVDVSASSGASTTRGATGDYSFAANEDNIASGARSSAFGSENTAAGQRSFICGYQGSTTSGGQYAFVANRQNQASGQNASAFGFSTVSSGQNAFTIGDDSIASGVSSFCGGDGGNASGSYAFVAGGQLNNASGNNSFCAGADNDSYSYGEFSIGVASTVYTPNSTVANNDNDRLFNVGNGAAFGTKSDAFTILKGGEVGINIDNFEANHNGKLLQVNGTAELQKGIVDDVTTGYTLTIDDKFGIVTMDNAGANTLTIPANASVAFPIGTEIVIINKGAGVTTVAITTDTLNQNVGGLTLAQYDKRTLIKIGATEWIMGY